MDLGGYHPRGLQNRLRGAVEASWVGSIPIHPRHDSAVVTAKMTAAARGLNARPQEGTAHDVSPGSHLPCDFASPGRTWRRTSLARASRELDTRAGRRRLENEPMGRGKPGLVESRAPPSPRNDSPLEVHELEGEASIERPRPVG